MRREIWDVREWCDEVDVNASKGGGGGQTTCPEIWTEVGYPSERKLGSLDSFLCRNLIDFIHKFQILVKCFLCHAVNNVNNLILDSLLLCFKTKDGPTWN